VDDEQVRPPPSFPQHPARQLHFWNRLQTERDRISRVQETSKTHLPPLKLQLRRPRFNRIRTLLAPVTPLPSPLSPPSPAQLISCTSYLIADAICYLTITDKSYPRKLAFSYLQELAKEFSTSYGTEALKPNLRPYAFVQFDTFISATKRVYQDSRAQSNLDRLNVELQDVTRVMTKNIEDLIYRGDSLDRMFPIRNRRR
jgi:Regulated-SNARE-like domain